MDPNSNTLRPIDEDGLLDDGTPAPEAWAKFQVDEVIVLRDYRFRIAEISSDSMRLVPVGPAKRSKGKRGRPNEKWFSKNQKRRRRKK